MKRGNQTGPTAHKTGFTFGLNSTKCPPQVKELLPFEKHLIKLVKNLKFRKVDNKFQRMLAKDVKGIRSSKKTLETKRQICIALVKTSIQTFCKTLLHQNISKHINAQQQI